MNDIINGPVDNVAFGGEGVLRTSEGVIFVHDVLPSEFISAQITQRKPRFARAKLLEVEQSHPLRIPPKCSHFSTCGGCHLQHADYALQIESKRQWLKDSLVRIAGLKEVTVPPIRPAENIWEYRRHITFHLKIEGARYIAFFHGRDPNVMIQPTHCPIFSDRSLAQLHQVVSEFPAKKGEEGRVQIMKTEANKWLYTFHFRNPPTGAWEIIQTLMLKDPLCAGVKLKTAREILSSGADLGTIAISGLNFAYSPEAFVQTHPDQSEAIYQTIAENFQSLRPKKVLDLYGGIGVTASLAAREGIEVTSVELNSTAVKLAKSNFQANGLRKGTFWCGDVLKYLKTNKFNQFDMIITNPPREGMDRAVVQMLAASRKPLLIVSCMPTTLARDIKILVESGYKLESIQGYDMFPQTTHFETVAFLSHS